MPNSDKSAVRAALLSPGGRAAVVAGDVGNVIRTARKALGWTQTDLGSLAGYSQAAISRMESGRTRISRDLEAITDVGAALGIPGSALGLADTAEDQDDEVRRREFLANVVSVSAMAFLPRNITDASSVTADGIAEGWQSLRRLVELDDATGGTACYPLAVDMVGHLRDALNLARMPGPIESDLQALTAAVMEQAGWVAYDGGRNEDARHWWLESSHLAEQSGAEDARITALASMSLQTSVDVNRARETLALVGSARRGARKELSPIARSLLSAREAVAYSQLGEDYESRRSIAKAKEFLSLGRTGGEPAAFDFWGPADLACHEMRAALYRRDGREAERLARFAYGSADPATFARNYVIYSVRLGQVLAMTGQYDESMAVTSGAIERFDAVKGSSRIRNDLSRTLDLLSVPNYRPAIDFAVAARRIVL